MAYSEKGSIWRKWDLQTCTNYYCNYNGPSFLSEQIEKLHELTGIPKDKIQSKHEDVTDEEFAKVYIEYLINYTNLDVIAITNHNTGKGIQAILEFLDSKKDTTQNDNKYNRLNLFSGVEVGASDKCHILIIFNPDTKNKNKFEYNQQGQCIHELSWDEYIESFLNKINIPAQRFVNNKPANSTDFTCEKILDLCKEWDFIPILPHINADTGWYKELPESNRKSSFKHHAFGIVDIRNSENNTDLMRILDGKSDDYGPKEVAKIHTSDSKSLTEIGKYFTWIKSDPTFEGLRQIVHEPKLRTRIQAEMPSDFETYACIEKCSVKFPADLKIIEQSSQKVIDFCFQGVKEINFSNNLTCIIGGRGSGKSTLMHILYNLWGPTFNKKLLEINTPLINLQVGVDALSKVRDFTVADIPSHTEFFFQNEIEKYAKDTETMSELILHRLSGISAIDVESTGKESLEVLKDKWENASTKIIALIKAYDKISELNISIVSLEKNMDVLRKQTEVIKSEEYKNFQTEINRISDKIAKFKQYCNDYDGLINQINSLVSWIEQISWENGYGNEILKALNNSLESYKKELAEKKKQIEEAYKNETYEQKITQKKQELKLYLSKKGLSPENIEELADANEQIKNLQEKIRLLHIERKPYDEVYKKRDEIKQIYSKAYENYKARYLEVAASLEARLSDLTFDHKIHFDLKADSSFWEKSVAKFIKEQAQSETVLRADDVQKVLFEDVDISSYIDDKEKIRKHVNEYSGGAIVHKEILEGLVNNDDFLEKLYLRILERCYSINNIRIQTIFGAKTLQNTSFGERCGITIAIVLIAGTNPIIIDQPEDNLDGRFVSNVLVELLRKQKHNRQIILITRDANIVIGGDAELINILDSDSGKTDVLSGTIENIALREKYVWLLDGGRGAFQKREQKYNFPHKWQET